MGWGDGWSSKPWGNGGWQRSHSNEDPIGQHLNTCSAGSSKTYDEHCPGCRYDRSLKRWKSQDDAGNGAIKLGSLLPGSKQTKGAKKSLWG